jgi:hypothetical protein
MHDYAYCGLDCKNCEYKGKFNCGGCKATCGHPFHGECKLAKCAIPHKVEHCGLCSSFPCDLLKEFSYDKEHGEEGGRIRVLESLKNIDDKVME